MLWITLIPALRAPLFIIALAALAALLVASGKMLAQKVSGWKAITGRFPMTDIKPTGDAYTGRMAVIGNTSYSGAAIRIAPQGVCFFPSFARRNPCLIPWSAIRRVSISESLHLVVDYERRFEFYLPVEALPALRARLSPQSFHQAASPFAVVKAAMADPATPRWMAWIAGRTLQAVEKEVAKNQPMRKETPDDL